MPIRFAVLTGLVLAGPLHAGLLSVPADYTPEKSWPVIVSLQDNPSPELAARTPYFLVHSGNIGAACSAGIHAQLKELAGKYRIDINRIYGTGFSRGGHELLEQAWHYPHLFAAIAPVCNDLRSEPKVYYVRHITTPTLLLHGDHDSFVRTGRRVHDMMKEAGCPVAWATYAGGHSPAAPFKQDLALLTRHFERHALQPFPPRVHHVVTHPRYARAFWVDCSLGENFLAATTQPGDSPRPPPTTAPGAMSKPYVVREGVFTVTVRPDNRIEVEANAHVVALDLYLNDKLVDMSRPVTVAMGAKVLYAGPAACPLKVKLSPAGELKAEHFRPLWEELAEIQKAARYQPLGRQPPP